MAKKEIKVKSYRTKDGKRVKQSRRRIKIAAGVAGVAAVGGLVAAVKNKRTIGKLISNSKSKNPKTDFSIPPTAKVPDKYAPDLNDIAFGPANAGFGTKVSKIASRLDDESAKIMSASSALDYGRGDEPGFFLTYLNKKTGKKEHLVKLSFLTGEKDVAGRPIDGVLTISLPEDVDPRFLDAEAVKKAAKSNKRLLEAIVVDEYGAQSATANDDKKDQVKSLYDQFLREGFPSTNKSNLVDLRSEFNKKFN